MPNPKLLYRSGLFLIIPLVVTVGGCTNVVRDPIPARQDVYRSGDPQQIFLDSTDLRNDTAVDTPTVFRDQNGLLHVTVPIRSVINRQLYVEYRAIFLDRNHQEIDRSPWHDKTLPANLPESISVVGTNPQADFFQIHLRYPISTQYR